jgi:DNA-binding CsgD family transcriptional regulator
MGDLVVSQIRKFIEWLSFRPTSDEIARGLATEYLHEFSAQSIRFSQLHNDDSITILGDYGLEDSHMWRNRSIPSSEWRALNTEPARVLKGEVQEKWCNNSTVYIETLRDRGVTQGHLMVVFGKTIDENDKVRVAETIQDLCIPLALYLSFQNRGSRHLAPGTVIMNESRESDAGQLSARQLSILRGMVEGKTNHELATEMGFSVSTIRHETMRIYQALAVSDRKEAAKKALMLSLI